MGISERVIDFYNNSSEEERLEMGLGPLEFERNKELISRYLTHKGMKILDIGGGTGKYSAWMADKGHRVSMIEPIEKHLEIARNRSRDLENPFEVIAGHARKLDLATNSFQMVILHGPLYHLPDREERLEALEEAKRVLIPGGILLGFAINYTASTLTALLQGLIHQPSVFKMCISELETGIHDAPDDLPGIPDHIFCHKPGLLMQEFNDCGMQDIAIYPVEGLTWLDKDYFKSRANPERKKNFEKLISLAESDPSLIVFSPHMMIAGKKPLK